MTESQRSILPRSRQAVLSLGSNLGARDRWLDLAGRSLERSGARLVGLTPRWHTRPRGAPPQPDYLNQLLLMEAPLDGLGWLALAEAAELSAGRVRSVPKGPRTLDVDVVLVDGEVASEPRLTLPHPALFERPHLLAGAAALVPEWTLPGWQLSVFEIARDHLSGSWARPVPVRAAAGQPTPEWP
ncbi:MAG: 2-amino-4-hydroxy-6-hydroxymethyldihydropteridine diphosphokinase [Candidatus Dormibacteria bacterium]